VGECFPVKNVFYPLLESNEFVRDASGNDLKPAFAYRLADSLDPFVLD